jgi:2-methylcitrate dehydratase PrpD
MIDEHRLKAADIEKVSIQTNPVVTRPIHMTKEITDHIVAQFSMPYCVAAAAHKVSFAEWQDPDKIRNPSILKFMDKIQIEAHPNFFEVQAKEPGSIMTTVEVTTQKELSKRREDSPEGFLIPNRRSCLIRIC